MTSLTVTDQRLTFRDPDLERSFARDGYVVIDFAPPSVIQECLDLYEALDSGITSGFYPSLVSPDERYKAATHRGLTEQIWPLFDRVLGGYEPHLGVFMVKHPGPETEVAPHQDWIVADEAVGPTMNAWIPLMPVTEEMGQMAVLPGSHRWLEGLRGSPTFPTQWEAAYERVRDELMVTVPVEVGQAMIYDIRLLHGTRANRSDTTRVVSSLYAIPQGATRLHYYRDPDDGTVAGYRVPADFCATFTIGNVPEGEPFIEIPSYTLEPLTFEEIARRHEAERATAAA